MSVYDPRFVSGELCHVTKDTVMVLDENNNIFRVSSFDPRYLSGELKSNLSGKPSNNPWNEESRKKGSQSKMGVLNPNFGKTGITEHLKKTRKCTNCDVVATLGNIARWHDDKCKVSTISEFEVTHTH